MSDITAPLGFSVAGHALCLALAVWLLPTSIPPTPEPLATGGIQVMLAPLPKTEKPSPQAEPPPPAVDSPPPEPQPTPNQLKEPVAATEPSPPPIEPPPPPPRIESPAPVVQPASPAPHKPFVKPPSKLAARHVEKAQPNLAPPPVPPGAVTAPAQLAPAPVAPRQTAFAPTPAPAPVPSTEVSPGYLAVLSSWLESHKRYPDSARQRGEEGRAVLRFTVDRNGRVIDFAVARSSGYADLDASIEEMMRAAVLPPFPATMTQTRVSVAVNIRFSLAR